MDDGHQVMAIPHMTLWVRWANNISMCCVILVSYDKFSGQNYINDSDTFHEKTQVQVYRKVEFPVTFKFSLQNF